MGRRALRSIDPSLDLSQHLKSIEHLPNPLDIASLFDRAAPLEIEVGSGKGLFLINASAEHPDRNFLGCEISRKYARFAAARLARAERGNARYRAVGGVSDLRRFVNGSTGRLKRSASNICWIACLGSCLVASDSG